MPLQVHDKNSSTAVFLDRVAATALFAKIAPDELEFEVVSTSEGAEASFPFAAKSGKKGSRFEVVLVNDGEALDVVIAGEFSVSVRSGVVGLFKESLVPIDFRIRGVIWKGGYFNGFTAWVKDSDYDQIRENYAETFPRVESYLLK